ncbi:MAG: pilus assembly protein TadG-related protein [Nocardioides sp.]
MATAERRDEEGQATVMIIGFAFVLAMAVAMVVDASAAYLQRQELDTVADGAALRGADLGATGREVYTGGVPEGRLDLSAERVRSAVHDHLAASGAYVSYPGLSFRVDVDHAASTVTVHVTAPLDLPLTVPGSPGVATIAATGSAVVVAER